MPSLKRLRYLVAVAETLHFRRAAVLCNISQPTLSGQLQELEERLGVQLVERSRSRVVLTPIGREIATRAKRVLSDVNDIVEMAKYGGAPFGGTVRVGVLPTVGPYLLPHLLPDLHRTYPYLKLYLRERVTQTLEEGLHDGTFDALLTPLPISGVDTVSVALYREPMVVTLPANHPLVHKTVIERTDLKGETVLALEPGHRLYEQVRDLCAQYGATISLDFGGTSLDTLRLMVGMGMGISLLPALYARSETPKDPNVVVRPLRNRPPSWVIGMTWRRQSARAAEFSILADLFQRILSEKVPEVISVR